MKRNKTNKLFAFVLVLAILCSLLPVLPVQAAFNPSAQVTLSLVRYDMPLGFKDGYGRTRHTVQKVAGPDAIDWPVITLKVDGESSNTIQPFKDSATYKYVPKWHTASSGNNMPLFQQSYDNVIEPGNHWYRAQEWRWGQQYVYTSDREARSWMYDYELWTFPVIIKGEGSTDVRNITLRYNGETIYTNEGTFHSLTLLLPQNEEGKPYELTVDGRGPVYFNAGLENIQLGNPKEVVKKIDLTIPGSPAITVKNLERPHQFPNQSDWDADVAALSGAKPEPIKYTRTVNSIKDYIGIEVPRSPVTINAVSLPHGMSGGFYYSNSQSRSTNFFSSFGTVEDFADYVSDTGYDRIFDQAGINDLGDIEGTSSYERMMAALASKGVLFGLEPDTEWKRPFIAHSNLPFFSYTLPDYRAPIYRDLQISMQRLNKFPNLAGVVVGADNAGYVSYWDWAPPIPNRPWAEAYSIFMGSEQPKTPMAPSHGTPQYLHEVTAANQKEFVDYIARFKDVFRQYGYIRKAVSEINPELTVTTGSFGSSPGAGARGGWRWATIPGKEMHEPLEVQQAYDWNERPASKPMHNVALIDRLRSYDPDKTTWTIIDDFNLFFGREARQRAYALALTRGVQAVGTACLPNPAGSKAQPDMIKDQKELYQWIHKFGGAYAMTEPVATVGILYVHEQALMRMNNQSETATDQELFAGSHEGKVTEALFLCNAAGWPAKVITPEELKRGLPSDMKSILLVGLENYDDSWHWYEGLTEELQSYVDKGGHILCDADSVSPLASVNTSMKIRSYVTQRDIDWTPELLIRNEDNIHLLNKAMSSIPLPLAKSDRSTLWAVPHQSGNTQYVTVVNQNYDLAQNASKYVKPQVGQLTWNTSRPIYDLRLGRKLTAEEAASCDLTTDGFRLYAIPEAEVTQPVISLQKGASGFYEASVNIGGSNPMTGIPLQITVSNGMDSATVYSATGLTARLPLRDSDKAGKYTVKVTELLSGLTGTASVETSGTDTTHEERYAVKVEDESDIASFENRLDKPLTIALTPEQAADADMMEQANRMKDYYESKGRAVSIGSVEPNRLVLSLQPLKAQVQYPKWKTIDSDLILMGTTSNNILLLDQAKGYLLPEKDDGVEAGSAVVSYSHSPFVGEYNVVNIHAKDVEGITYAVDYLLTGVKAPLSNLGKPDLIVTDVTVTPETPLDGQKVTLTAKVKNQGKGRTAKGTVCKVGFKIDDGPVVAWSDSYKASIGPDTSITIEADTGELVVPAGTHKITAVIDVDKIIDEEDETNNQYEKVVNAVPCQVIDGKLQAESRYAAGGLTLKTSVSAEGGKYEQFGGNGTWGDFAVNVQKFGWYEVQYRVACDKNPSTCKLELRKSDGSILDTTAIPRTGVGLTWQVLTSKVYLEEGIQPLKIRADVGGWNLDWVNFNHLFEADTEAPASPAGLTLVSKTHTSLKLSWAASSDNIGVKEYRVYLDDALTGTTTGTNYEVKNLMPGMEYRFIVKALDATGNSSEPSEEFHAATHVDSEAPSVPTGLKVMSATSTAIEISWSVSNDNVGVDGYEVYLDGEPIAKTKGRYTNFYFASGLLPGTTHTFQVKARDTAGNISAASVELIVSTLADATPPSAPVNLALVSKTCTSAELSWTPSYDNIRTVAYDVYSGGVYAGSSVEEAVYTVKGLKPLTTYSFMVKARDASGNLSEPSNVLTVTTEADTEAPAAPAELVSPGKTCTSVDLEWPASTDNVGVAGYKVYNGGLLAGETSGDTKFTVKGLKPLTRYSFSVRAKDEAGNVSQAGKELSIMTDADVEAPTVPTDLNVTGKTGTTVDLSWSESTDNAAVAGYDIYKDAELIGRTAQTSFTVTGLKPEGVYRFTVKARDEAGNVSFESNAIKITMGTDAECPSAPTGVESPSNTLKSVFLSWEEASDNVGVTGYHIYCDNKLVGSTAGATTYTVAELKPNRTYIFTVRAKDAAGNISPDSEELSVITDILQVVEAEKAGLSGGAIAAEDARALEGKCVIGMESKGASIAVSGIDGGAGIFKGNKKQVLPLKIRYLCSGTTETLTLYVNGKKSATVRLLGRPGISSAKKGYRETVVPVELERGDTNTILLKNETGSKSEIRIDRFTVIGGTIVDSKAPTAPTNLCLASKAENRVDLSWTASTDNVGIEGYEIYCGDQLVGTTQGETTYTAAGLEVNTTYTFHVKARDAAGNVSDKSNILSITTNEDEQAPSAPSNLTATSKTDTSVALSWTAAEDNIGVTAYDIYQDGTLASSVSGTTVFLAEGLERNTTYVFLVKARDAAGNSSSASNAVTVKTNPDTQPPTAPEGLMLISKTCISAEFKWEASADNAGVTNYEIFIGGTPAGRTNGETSYKLTSLKPSTAYEAVVKAKDAAGNLSAASHILAFTTDADTEAPTAPADLACTGKSYTTIGLTWKPSTDNVSVASYSIYKDESLAGTTDGAATFTVTGLEINTAYVFTVKARDGAGNLSAASSPLNVSTEADTTAPSAPSNLTLTAKSETSIELSWLPSTDDTGVAEYLVFLEDKMIGTTAGTTFTAAGLLPSTVYNFTVKAEDTSGNLSAASNVLTITTSSVLALEAEKCTLGGGASINNDSYASGGKYVGGMHIRDAYITLSNIDGGPGGIYTLKIRYATANTNAKKSLYVNGVDVEQLKFPSTGGWQGSGANYTEVVTTVRLNPGTDNTIMIRCDAGDSDGVNIDSFKVIG